MNDSIKNKLVSQVATKDDLFENSIETPDGPYKDEDDFGYMDAEKEEHSETIMNSAIKSKMKMYSTG